MDELTPEEREAEGLSFFHRHRTKFITGTIAVAAVAVSTYAIQQAKQTATEVEGTVKKVRVIERSSSNCLPKPGETKPRRPALCKAGFDKAVQLINPSQACQIVAKGAKLLVINGQRVREVQCITLVPQGSPDEDGASSSPAGQTRSSAQTPRSSPGRSPQQHQGNMPSKKNPKNSPPTPAPQPAPTPAPESTPEAGDNGQGKDKGNHGEDTGNEGPKGNGQGDGNVGNAVEETVGGALGLTCGLPVVDAALCPR